MIPLETLRQALSRMVIKQDSFKSFFGKKISYAYEIYIPNILRSVQQLNNYLRNTGKCPDFVIIGVQKGGTSSLWMHLQKHPQIEMSPNFVCKYPKGWLNTKEIHFFDRLEKFKKGLRWYKSLFNNNGRLQGEATPDYISSLQAHTRMKKVIPDAKFILLLRNPIDRAYSSYNHQIQRGIFWEKGVDGHKTFDDALEYYSKSNSLDTMEFISKGFYCDQINNLLRYYKREQILIVVSEKMRADPQSIYDQIFDFLDIDRVQINYYPNIHKRTYPHSMSSKTRGILKDFYGSHNEKLFDLLGYRITEWD